LDRALQGLQEGKKIIEIRQEEAEIRSFEVKSSDFSSVEQYHPTSLKILK
jgi:hypothetical protein